MLHKKNASLWLILLLLTLPVKAQNAAATKLPDTPAGGRVAAYVKAFNSGDEQVMRQFIAENVAPSALQQRPVEARIEIYRNMRSDLGRLELRRVAEASESAIKVLAQSKEGEWLELGFQFEPQPPHKLLGLRVERVDAPQTAAGEVKTPASLTEAQAVAFVENYLKELVAADEFSGTVLLAKGDRPIFQQAYGLASKEFNVPNRVDTKFNLGSINKIFTQVAIGQLVAQGKLSFDDKLGKFLPDYPNRDAADKVTIRQLLDMKSGIGDFFGPRFESTPKNSLRAIKDFLPLFAGAPLAFEPGTSRQYSNGGYIVLGAIIEKASGQDYYEYVREHVFKPAGMHNADWYEADMPTPNLASGYIRAGTDSNGKPARKSNLYTRPAKGSPAGGGYAAAEDLLKFSLALQTGKLRLPDFRGTAGAEKRTSTEGKPPNFPGLGIAGGAPGINAILEVDGETGYTLIVMSNYDPPSAMEVGKKIRGWLAQIKN